MIGALDKSPTRHSTRTGRGDGLPVRAPWGIAAVFVVDALEV